MSVEPPPPAGFETSVPVLVIGAGAAGLVAALAAREAGADVLVLERDPLPRGSTALSAGLIPAAGTRQQRERGIVDGPDRFLADVQKKAGGTADPLLAALVTREAAPTVEWLADRHGLPFSLVDDFDYPGHSARRMHGLPSRSGLELVDRLRQAVEVAGITILVEATVVTLFADAGRRVVGVRLRRPDGTEEVIGCGALVLACSGFGGNAELVARYIPAIASAPYFGHAGNHGDAVLWGAALGAKLAAMAGHQGHGSVAHPHGMLVTWAVIMEGGFQVNAQGLRFSDESRGYSEQASAVLAQPGGVAFDVFDERIAGVARQFDDFRQAEASGAVIEAATPNELAQRLKLPIDTFVETFESVEQLKSSGVDRFRRTFAGLAPLEPPFKAVRVTGGLFHTQGGLAIDGAARVVDDAGASFPNLFAAGGAAVGISGSHPGGYLSGNGLLTAVVLGRIAGTSSGHFAESPTGGPVFLPI